MPPKQDTNSITARAITLVANETVLELSKLQDSANVAELGVDSLMSFVNAEKFREQLQVTARGSFFWNINWEEFEGLVEGIL